MYTNSLKKPFSIFRGEVHLPPVQFSDPFNRDQLGQTGQTIPYGLEKLNVPLLHKKGITGKGVVVAILDTGVSRHSD
ncbi:MAG: hypothetical protein HY559_03675, partial [Gammaproteobacteria bacterium]|nr:hypothetical protein [Gammaproteobacteria bacterium]